jgi:hypothetical protein
MLRRAFDAGGGKLRCDYSWHAAGGDEPLVATEVSTKRLLQILVGIEERHTLLGCISAGDGGMSVLLVIICDAAPVLVLVRLISVGVIIFSWCIGMHMIVVRTLVIGAIVMMVMMPLHDGRRENLGIDTRAAFVHDLATQERRADQERSAHQTCR